MTPIRRYIRRAPLPRQFHLSDLLTALALLAVVVGLLVATP